MRLDADRVSVAIGERRIVRDVSLHIASGSLVGLVGPNGAGKTTLLRALTGLLPVASGSIALDGRALGDIPAAERARALAYLPQSGASLWPVSVADLVLLGRLPHGASLARPREEDLAVARAVMRELDLQGLAERRCTELSGGERARVLLARALAGEPDVLIADEPVANLDPYHALEVMERLRARVDGGMAALVTLHDLTLAMRFCDTVVLLSPDGESATAGRPEDVLTAESLRTVYRVDALFGRERDAPWVLPWRRHAAQDSRGGQPASGAGDQEERDG